MKRLATILVWLIVAAAAAAPISEHQARMIASRYALAGHELTRVDGVRLAPQRVGSRADGAYSHTSASPAYYVFSRGSGVGFVIVSGDDLRPEVIGFCENGDFVFDEMPPALQDMLSSYEQSASQGEKDAPGEKRKAMRASSGTKDVAPLLQTHWHQDWPYNGRCPWLPGGKTRAATGCLATAVSQLLYYWHRDLGDCTLVDTPTYAYGAAPVDESCVIPAGTPLRWELMLPTYDGGESQESCDAVAVLMAVAGMSGWLSYGESTSGQIQDYVTVLSSQFGMNGGSMVWRGYSQTGWEKMILSDLEGGRPVLYSGVHVSEGGHAVVLDGYRVADNLFHFNFGWGGVGDGYYTVDDAGMAGFSESQGMICQISPKRTNVVASFQETEEPFYLRMKKEVQVTVSNQGTLPVKGFYLYCVKGLNRPTASTASTYLKAKDETQEVAPGESVTLKFNYAPVTKGSFIMYLCDSQMNILAESGQMEVLDAEDGIGNVPTTQAAAVYDLSGRKTANRRLRIENGRKILR